MITIYSPRDVFVGWLKARLDINEAKRYVQTSKNGLYQQGPCYGHVHPENEFWTRLSVTVNDHQPGEVACYMKHVQKFRTGWLTRWVEKHPDQGRTDMDFLTAFLGGPGAEEASRAFAERQAMTPNFLESLMEHGAQAIGDPESGIQGLVVSGQQMVETMFAKLDPREALEKINEMSKAHGHDPEDPDSECETITDLLKKFGGAA